MIVLFTPATGIRSSEAIKKYASINLQQNFSIQVNTDNLFVLRIADTNWINGSWYCNTSDFPDYQESINQLIRTMIKKNNINEDNVVLYGTSRGGAAVMLYCLLYHYKGVAVDPLISPNFRKGKQYLLFEDLTGLHRQINSNKITNKNLKVLSSDQSMCTFPWLAMLDNSMFDFYNISLKQNNSSGLGYHGILISELYPLAVTHIRKLLSNERIVKNSINIDNFDVYPPYWTPSYYWVSKYSIVDGFILERTSNEINSQFNDRWIKFELKQHLKISNKYKVRIVSDSEKHLDILFFTEKADWVKISINSGEEYFFCSDKNYKGIALTATMYPDVYKKINLREIFVEEYYE